MISTAHEALHRIFQDDSTLFSRAFRKVLGIDFPTPRMVSILTHDLTEIKPVARHADTILLIETEVEDHILVIESQTRDDEGKRYTWPYYISYLHTTYKLPVTLLVVCPDTVTAAWARVPIQVGLPEQPSQITIPWVFGPDNVPMITDPTQAAGDVVWTVFSALTHRLDDNAGETLTALAAALDTIDDEEVAGYWAEFTEVGLGDTAAAEKWRNLMSTLAYHYPSRLRLQGREEGREEGRAEGRAEGEAEAILEVLATRSIDVPTDARTRITTCTDRDQLRIWIRRAVTATSIDELFD